MLTVYITPNYKKGNKNDPSNYGGKTVTISLSFLYGSVVKNRLNNKIPEEQAGFRSGRSSTDNVFTVAQVLEKQVAPNQEVNLVFIDLPTSIKQIELLIIKFSVRKQAYQL